MIERMTEKRLVEQVVVVCGLCTCDICGKTIYKIVDDKHCNHVEY